MTTEAIGTLPGPSAGVNPTRLIINGFQPPVLPNALGCRENVTPNTPTDPQP